MLSFLKYVKTDDELLRAALYKWFSCLYVFYFPANTICLITEEFKTILGLSKAKGKPLSLNWNGPMWKTCSSALGSHQKRMAE